MGRKLKLAQLAILFVLYFFPGLYSGSDNGSYPGTCTLVGSVEPALQRSSGRDNVYHHTLLGQGYEEDTPRAIELEAYLIASDRTRYPNASFVQKPIGTSFRVAVTPSNIFIWFNLNVDGESMNVLEEFKLDEGVHMVELWATYFDEELNDTVSVYFQWTVQVLSREAYEAMHIEAEPEGLRLRAAIIAAISALVGLPVGMLLKHRRAKEYEL